MGRLTWAFVALIWHNGSFHALTIISYAVSGCMAYHALVLYIGARQFAIVMVVRVELRKCGLSIHMWRLFYHYLFLIFSSVSA